MGKVAYRIENWKDYNQALCRRGDITLWIDQDTIKDWYARKESRHGACRTYSDMAIQCALILRSVYRLPLRQTRGFLGSLLRVMRLDLKVPCYSTLSRRAVDLAISLPCTGQAKHIVIDSTGLKVYGEGEWKVRLHGKAKRRTWRKLHLAVDADSQEITAVSLTSNDFHDSEVFEELLDKNNPPEATYADGAYDTRTCYDPLEENDIKAIIPPRKGAKIAQHGNSKRPPLARDENIRGIRSMGRKGWKKQSGYHRRSLAETAMFRIKKIFGANLNSRNFQQQASEVFIRARALNIMTGIGMPKSKAVI